jgi:hypothetical protein
MFGDLKSGPQWNYEFPHALGGLFHLQNLKFESPTKKFGSLKRNYKI